MKMTNEELSVIGKRKIVSIMKRLNANIAVTITVGESVHKFDGEFYGRAKSISSSYIKMSMIGLSDVLTLRTWLASLTIIFIHEWSHYILFKEMSIKEREENDRKYNKYGYYRDKDEAKTWDLTIKVLKKLGYWKGKAVKEEFHKFTFPLGYEIK